MRGLSVHGCGLACGCAAQFWGLGTRAVLFFFFFSSRRRHTRFDCDWSSDVCSSDLRILLRLPEFTAGVLWVAARLLCQRVNQETAAERITGSHQLGHDFKILARLRSEERRVGKECRSRWSPYH